MKARELYRYAPDAGKWCRHGLRRIVSERGQLYAIDTYWDDWSNGDPRRVEEIQKDLEFVVDLSAARKVSRDVYERFAEKDRAWIPMGGGSEQYWVSTSATPNPENTRAWLQSKLKHAQSDLRVAQNRVNWAEDELAQFEEAQRGAVA
jgi:hypothetical protein